MKNCIILHGCPSDEERAMDPEKRSYDKHWIPWTKKKLEKHGIKTTVPLMPSPWKPNYESFKDEFEKNEVNEDTILIGHSCGCAFLVRWLGESKQKIDKLILVAPWKIPYREDGSDKDFYNYEIDETIKENVNKVIIFTSNDEEDDGKKSVGIYCDALGGWVIELKNHGHYTRGDMGTEEFPELLNEISKNVENANVKMILINPNNKIFLLHREDIPNIEVPNKWSFVGGALDEGETPMDGAIRETKEEINFDVKDAKLFKEYDDPGIRRYVYIGTIDKEISELNLTEGDDMGFFTVEEALKMNISKNTKRYINEYF